MPNYHLTLQVLQNTVTIHFPTLGRSETLQAGDRIDVEPHVRRDFAPIVDDTAVLIATHF